MEEQIKKIIAPLLKLAVTDIQANTIIDRSAVASSILLHRMYANLAKEGFDVHDYWNIKTFADLMQQLNVTYNQTLLAVPTLSNNEVIGCINPSALSIGIDIEAIDVMPLAVDYREDAFYTANFSANEIAYSILQPNTLATFAGLFAAKEAIVKADNTFKKTPFNKIAIDHLESGKPIFNQFAISIAHANAYATAIAIPSFIIQQANPTVVAHTTAGKNYITNLLVLTISLIAIVTAVIAIYIVVSK